MKKFFLLCSLLVSLWGYLFLFSPSSYAATNLIQIGDSLTVGLHEAGIESKYQAAGWTAIIPGDPSKKVEGDFCSGADAGYPCHAVSGGNSPTGIEAVDSNKDQIKSAAAIVIQLGTNRLEGNDTDAFKNAMSQMISKVKAINPSIKIYWVNLAALVNIDAYNTRNTVINEVMQATGGTVINWHNKISPNDTPTSSYFGSDGIHLTAQGYTLMAETIVSSVGSASDSSSNFNGNSGPTSATACWLTKVGTPTSPQPPLPADCNTTGTGGGIVNCDEPIPTTNVDQALKQKFNITLTGFDNDHLMWAYERFCEVGKTGFLSLVNGAKVLSVPANISQQIGCPGELARINPQAYGDNNVIIFPYTPKEFFKFIIIHELGHVIHNCHNRDQIGYNALVVAAQKEGGVSYYANNAAACTDSDNQAEDYADSVAYYLDHAAGQSTARCGGLAPASPPNPFWGSPVLKPLHFDIMKNVIK